MLYVRAGGNAPDDHEIRWHSAARLLRLAPEPFRRREAAWPALAEATLERAARILGDA